MTDAAQVDLHQVLREIDEEVRSRRASGDFPPGMERDLDLVFARFAPAMVGDDLHGLLEAAERHSFIDPDPPVASKLPPVALLKKVERKLLGWFFRFIAQQVTAFGGVAVQALRLIGRRLEALEEATPGVNPALVDAARRSSRPAPTGALTTALAAHLAGVTGRVLVGEAADGSLLREVAATGADAYGIEPRIELADSLALAGLDVRADEVAAHLDDVDDDVLGGLVLAGVVDRVPLGAQVALVARAAAVLAPGGRLAVVASSPATWGTANPVEADLAPGRPLHPETWAHLLTEHGFSDVHVTGGEPVALVTAVR